MKRLLSIVLVIALTVLMPLGVSAAPESLDKRVYEAPKKAAQTAVQPGFEELPDGSIRMTLPIDDKETMTMTMKELSDDTISISFSLSTGESGKMLMKLIDDDTVSAVLKLNTGEEIYYTIRGIEDDNVIITISLRNMPEIEQEDVRVFSSLNKLAQSFEDGTFTDGIKGISLTEDQKLMLEVLQEEPELVSSMLKNMSISFDTLSSDKASIDGRLYFPTAGLENWKGSYKTEVKTTNKNIETVKSRINGWYANKVAVVEISQNTSLVVNTHIAANLKDFSSTADNLYFYSYNPVDNKIAPLSSTNAHVDSAGYLHFYTNIGGYIVISQGPLA